MRQRFLELDFLRGIAILWMVLLHFIWDINYYNIRRTDLLIQQTNILCSSLFFILVGISLSITASRKPREYIIKQGIFIFLLGLVLTGWSFFLLPYPIYFGALHFIGFSMIIGAFLVKFRYLNILLSSVVIYIGIYHGDLFSIGPYIDYFPPFPWFGAVLFGIFLGNTLYKDGQRQFYFPNLPAIRPIRTTSWLGRHSLSIYLAHQPAIAGTLILLKSYFPQVLSIFSLF